ncbi:MAG: hypothetical protein CVT86_01800 [Alphaproteobacteria bacterium HGW-Alphaproteobacteria-8]|nr:MAG: hypothetical protein CVT86_01800 [Alphaproteobacteria bacterium HGW-Alphaproteobacteria-8]
MPDRAGSPAHQRDALRPRWAAEVRSSSSSSWSCRSYEAQRRMLEAAARRPRSRDDLAERLRDGRF